MGGFNLITTFLVVFFFLIKRGPLLLENMWIKYFNSTSGRIKKFFKGIYLVLVSLCVCLRDTEFMYYFFYMIFGVWGIIVHPFFFLFHLTDFLRIELLSFIFLCLIFRLCDQIYLAAKTSNLFGFHSVFFDRILLHTRCLQVSQQSVQWVLSQIMEVFDDHHRPNIQRDRRCRHFSH